jgi:hypothetical protein
MKSPPKKEKKNFRRITRQNLAGEQAALPAVLPNNAAWRNRKMIEPNGVPDEPARGKDIEKPEPDPYDPFAPENLKLPQEFLDQTMATTLLTTIPVVRPGDQEFIRVHPDEGYRHVAALITHHDERGARYLIHPTFLPQIGNIKFHLERLYLYTSRQGKLAFWPIKMPKDHRENTWLESAVAAAEAARTEWVCIISNQQSKMYTISKALGEFPDPDWPAITQGKNVYQLLAIAFKERLIQNETHPLIQKLRGLK